jgi:hypothetical protein
MVMVCFQLTSVRLAADGILLHGSWFIQWFSQSALFRLLHGCGGFVLSASRQIFCLCVGSSFKSRVSMLVVVVMGRYGVCDVVLLAGLICYRGDGV